MRLEYFQMLDRVLELDPEAGRVRAECRVPDHSPVFEGHFPGHPILPGVLMIEAIAQTGGWLILARARFDRMAFLAQVREAKLRGFVTPGDQLRAEAHLVHDGSGYAVARGCLDLRGLYGRRGRDHLPRRPVPHRGAARRCDRGGAPCRRGRGVAACRVSGTP